jgi:hypothetical protein
MERIVPLLAKNNYHGPLPCKNYLSRLETAIGYRLSDKVGANAPTDNGQELMNMKVASNLQPPASTMNRSTILGGCLQPTIAPHVPVMSVCPSPAGTGFDHESEQNQSQTPSRSASPALPLRAEKRLFQVVQSISPANQNQN